MHQSVVCRSLAAVALGVVGAGLAGCGPVDTGATAELGEDVGAITLELTTVPSDVRCVEVFVEGAVRTVTRRFDVTPGSSAALSLSGLPLGEVSIDEQTFGVRCSQVRSTTEPTWVSEPAAATLTAAQSTSVSIVLRRPGSVAITNDFQDAPPPGASLGGFDGFLYQAPCADSGTGFDCQQVGCVNFSKTFEESFTLTGGTPGVVYDVSLRVRGVVEAKNYRNGVRRAGMLMDASTEGGDFWYEGGAPLFSSYNSFELHVSPPVAGAPNSYFLNARNGSSEAHQTWALNYTASIRVPAGGTVLFRTFDPNCREITNCGPGTGSSTCAAPRVLTVAADPSPPASFSQPNLGGPAPGQWLFFDVLSITPI